MEARALGAFLTACTALTVANPAYATFYSEEFHGGGTFHLTATLDGSTVADATVGLRGQGFNISDPPPTPPTLYSISLASDSNTIPLSGTLSGVSVQLSWSLTFDLFQPGSASSLDEPRQPGPFDPHTYDYTVGPAPVSGVAIFTGGINLGSAIDVSNPTASGQVLVYNVVYATLHMDEVTLGSVDLPPSGSFPGGVVTFKADRLEFIGQSPEPGTALLVSLGLLSTAWARAHRPPASRGPRRSPYW